MPHPGDGDAAAAGAAAAFRCGAVLPMADPIL